MNRFFFHLHDSERLLDDQEGVSCLTLDEARERAVTTARDLMASEVRKGHLNLAWYILIANENGSVVANLPFEDAVTIHGVTGERR